MAYAHFWSRALELERDSFIKASEDVKRILSRAQDMGLQLAGPTGKGTPILSNGMIAFNGASDCGHRYRDLGAPFPSETAHGVEEVEPPYDPRKEPYLSGPYLETRVCGGSCAAQAFVVDRVYLVRDWERPEEADRYACSCETHFKPYDLVVTATLIRIKEHLGKAVVISSEDPEHGFEDALRFCRELFGWTNRFEINRPQSEVLL